MSEIFQISDHTQKPKVSDKIKNKKDFSKLIDKSSENFLLDASNIEDKHLLKILDFFKMSEIKRIKIAASGSIFQNNSLIDKCFQNGVYSFVILLPDSWKDKSLKNNIKGVSNLYNKSIQYKYPFFLSMKINVNDKNLSELFDYVKLISGINPDMLIFELNLAEIKEKDKTMLQNIIRYCESNNIWVKLEGVGDNFNVNKFSWCTED